MKTLYSREEQLEYNLFLTRHNGRGRQSDSLKGWRKN